MAEMRASAANANGAERDARRERTNDTTKTFAQPAFRVPRGGVDAGDHPDPPASAARSPSDVGGVDAWRVYDLVVRRFVAACARDCVVEQQTLVLEAGGELFDAFSCVVKRAGWTEAMPWRAPTERAFSPTPPGDVEALETVSTLAVAGVALEPGLTSPPPRMTESELIGLMETHGIGTDASIPSPTTWRSGDTSRLSKKPNRRRHRPGGRSSRRMTPSTSSSRRRRRGALLKNSWT